MFFRLQEIRTFIQDGAAQAETMDGVFLNVFSGLQ